MLNLVMSSDPCACQEAILQTLRANNVLELSFIDYLVRACVLSQPMASCIAGIHATVHEHSLQHPTAPSGDAAQDVTS